MTLWLSPGSAALCFLEREEQGAEHLFELLAVSSRQRGEERALVLEVEGSNLVDEREAAPGEPDMRFPRSAPRSSRQPTLGRRRLEASEHCSAWELSRCVEDPTHYTLRIEWDSVEGHIQGFRSSSEFKQFVSDVGAFYAETEEMRHYAPTNVVGGSA